MHVLRMAPRMRDKYQNLMNSSHAFSKKSINANKDNGS